MTLKYHVKTSEVRKSIRGEYLGTIRREDELAFPSAHESCVLPQHRHKRSMIFQFSKKSRRHGYQRKPGYGESEDQIR